MFELKKIGIVKRASAWLLDAILLAVLTTGIMWIVSLICDFNGAQARMREYNAAWDDFRTEYVEKVSSFYGYVYTETADGEYFITKDGNTSSLNDVMADLAHSEGNDPETREAYEKYSALPPPRQVELQTEYVFNLLFMMTSVGLLVGYIILEFILPLILKNGQTVGKKVFGIGLVRPNCVRVTPLALFARMLLGKFAIETMFPILLIFLFFFGGLGILAVILLAALLILNIVLFFATKNHTPIHDILAYTVAVDIKVQYVFGSDEELSEKKALAERERLEQQKNI